LSEEQTTLGQAIGVWRLDELRSVARQIAVSQVVGVNEHDIRVRGIGSLHAEGGDQG
jgi:hypothetical protein